MALQILAFPVVARVLGPERFGIFTLVSSLLFFLEFAQFGIGGYLTQQIATRLLTGDWRGIRSRLWTAMGMVGILAILIVLILLGTTEARGLQWLWGSAAVSHQAALQWGFHFLLFTGVATLLLNLFQGCQAGYQELHIGNLYNGAGNLLTAGGILVVAQWPQVGEVQFWSILYGIPLVALSWNAIALVRRHPELSFHPAAFHPRLIPELLRSGGGFLIIQTALPMVHREGSRLYLTQHSNLIEVGHFGSFLQMATILGGCLAIFTTPLYSGIADAHARGDRKWCQDRLRWMRGYGLALALIFALGSHFLGPWAWKVWLGPAFVIERKEFLAFAAYFSVTAILHVHHVFMLAQGYVRQATQIALLEIAILIPAILLAAPASTAEVFWVMTGVQLVASLPLSTLLLRLHP